MDATIERLKTRSEVSWVVDPSNAEATAHDG
jgi:hypothetical protein